MGQTLKPRSQFLSEYRSRSIPLRHAGSANESLSAADRSPGLSTSRQNTRCVCRPYVASSYFEYYRNTNYCQTKFSHWRHDAILAHRAAKQHPPGFSAALYYSDAPLPATRMRTRLLLLLTLALCAFLRFYHLDGYGLWSDEFVTLLIVSSSSFQELVQTCFDVPQPMPPLYFLANKWMYGFLAPGEIGLRALSAVGSVLAGFFLFATGRALFNAEIGLWGLMLFAVNSTQIVYAQNARPYAVCLMLSSASMFCFLKWKHQPSRAWALGYVISTACCSTPTTSSFRYC